MNTTTLKTIENFYVSLEHPDSGGTLLSYLNQYLTNINLCFFFRKNSKTEKIEKLSSGVPEPKLPSLRRKINN